ncbi:hypothetical protein QBC45DRAFT_437957 [Copromyces sp. CBS 386.78]|nr:hypothetical protein QBC45DRAFT_437957 [Copromyces sp. CBS 386.78]
MMQMADAATQPTGARDRGAQAIDLTLIDPSLRPSIGDTPVEPSEPSESHTPSEPTLARWTFDLRQGHESHSHLPSKKPLIHSIFKPQYKAFVATYIDRPGMTNREITTELEKKFPELKGQFTNRQLINLRYKLKKEAQAGYTPFQLTMKLLTEKGIHFESFKLFEGMKKNIENETEKQVTRAKVEYLAQPWAREACRKVCWKALDKVVRQRRIALGAVPTAANPDPDELELYTGKFTAQYSLPCSHTILETLLDRSQTFVLDKLDCYPYWWLHRSLDDEDEYLKY